MNSEISELRFSYTQRGLRRYEVEIRHRGLNKFQLVRGDDPHIVKQKARAKTNEWDEMWAKRERKEEEIRTIEGNYSAALVQRRS